MAMTERAYDYQQAQSYELRRMRILDGTAAQEKANARRADVVKLSLAVVAVLVYLLSVTFMEAKIDDAGAQINNLKAQIAETENNALIAELKIGELASLDRVESYAVANLGMICPAADSFHYLNRESSMMIAAGLAETEIEISVEDTFVESQPFWKSIGSIIREHFVGGTAIAAEK